MLLWQRIAWHKRYTFLSKLFFFSALGHSLLLLTIFFFYKGENFTHTITFDTHDITVMFLPFQKTVAQSQPQGRGKGRDPSRMKVVSASKGKKVAAKNDAKKTPQAQSKKPATALTNAKTKKEQTKKPVAPQKEKHVVAKKIEKPEQVETKKVMTSDEMNVEQENIVCIGQQDLNALELREEIRREIEHVWHPPVGLAPDKSCKVRVVIDWQGNIGEIDFEESSQIVAFDASVRHALLTMKFPKSSYGKELILPFC